MKKEFKYTLNGKNIELPKDKIIQEFEIEIVGNKDSEEKLKEVVLMIRKHIGYER